MSRDLRSHTYQCARRAWPARMPPDGEPCGRSIPSHRPSPVGHVCVSCIARHLRVSTVTADALRVVSAHGTCGYLAGCFCFFAFCLRIERERLLYVSIFRPVFATRNERPGAAARHSPHARPRPMSNVAKPRRESAGGHRLQSRASKLFSTNKRAHLTTIKRLAMSRRLPAAPRCDRRGGIGDEVGTR